MLHSIFSHNLAFGIFWMVIPHVSIVANLTLSGTSPSSWDLVNLDRISENYDTRQDFRKRGGISQRLSRHFGLSTTENSYSTYLLAWQWDRGRCKMSWFEKFFKEYPTLDANLRTNLRVSTLEWVGYVWIPTLFMLLVPCALGSLIRYVPENTSQRRKPLKVPMQCYYTDSRYKLQITFTDNIYRGTVRSDDHVAIRYKCYQEDSLFTHLDGDSRTICQRLVLHLECFSFYCRDW